MSKDVKIRPEQEFRAGMRSMIGERWRVLWKALPAAIANEDPEGVHQVRVASRRLRAAMDVSADCFPAKWYRPLHKTAKEITSALGEVRDRDVLLEEFAKLRRRATASERLGIERLTGRIEAEREPAVDDMIAYLKKLEASGIRKVRKRRFPVDDDLKRNSSEKRSKGKKGSRS